MSTENIPNKTGEMQELSDEKSPDVILSSDAYIASSVNSAKQIAELFDKPFLNSDKEKILLKTKYVVNFVTKAVQDPKLLNQINSRLAPDKTDQTFILQWQAVESSIKLGKKLSQTEYTTVERALVESKRDTISRRSFLKGALGLAIGAKVASSEQTWSHLGTALTRQKSKPLEAITDEIYESSDKEVVNKAGQMLSEYLNPESVNEALYYFFTMGEFYSKNDTELLGVSREKVALKLIEQVIEKSNDEKIPPASTLVMFCIGGNNSFFSNETYTEDVKISEVQAGLSAISSFTGIPEDIFLAEITSPDNNVIGILQSPYLPITDRFKNWLKAKVNEHLPIHSYEAQRMFGPITTGIFDLESEVYARGLEAMTDSKHPEPELANLLDSRAKLEESRNSLKKSLEEIVKKNKDLFYEHFFDFPPRDTYTDLTEYSPVYKFTKAYYEIGITDPDDIWQKTNPTLTFASNIDYNQIRTPTQIEQAYRYYTTYCFGSETGPLDFNDRDTAMINIFFQEQIQNEKFRDYILSILTEESKEKWANVLRSLESFENEIKKYDTADAIATSFIQKKEFSMKQQVELGVGVTKYYYERYGKQNYTEQTDLNSDDAIAYSTFRMIMAREVPNAYFHVYGKDYMPRSLKADLPYAPETNLSVLNQGLNDARYMLSRSPDAIENKMIETNPWDKNMFKYYLEINNPHRGYPKFYLDYLKDHPDDDKDEGLHGRENNSVYMARSSAYNFATSFSRFLKASK